MLSVDMFELEWFMFSRIIEFLNELLSNEKKKEKYMIFAK